jgi:hypothetical protein
MDISGLTLQITGENFFAKGRFYMLWRVVIVFSHLAYDVSETIAGRMATSSLFKPSRGGGPASFLMSRCP